MRIFIMILCLSLSGCVFYKEHSMANGNMFKKGEPQFNDPRTIGGNGNLF